MRYGFAIDTKRCIGCHTCSVSCRIENNLPEGTWWNRVLTKGGESMDTPEGTFPDATMSYITVASQHCVGCRMCMAAWPYVGVRSFNWEEPAHYIGFDSGDADVSEHQKHTVEKCTFCWHRLAKGEDPMCVKTCLARARVWGDLDDPESEVSKLIRERRVMQLLPEKDTKPSVYYLV